MRWLHYAVWDFAHELSSVGPGSDWLMVLEKVAILEVDLPLVSGILIDGWMEGSIPRRAQEAGHLVISQTGFPILVNPKGLWGLRRMTRSLVSAKRCCQIPTPLSSNKTPAVVSHESQGLSSSADGLLYLGFSIY